jgi:16S rRNA (cytidine1402-2'-O)-methyltransferase
MTPTLFLLPVPLGDTPVDRTLPPYNREIIVSLRYFIVENIRSARRFLKLTEPGIAIDALTFFLLNQHTAQAELPTFLQPLRMGESVGLLSEAGCPAVADPGADIVKLAQQQGFRVQPLAGPSSIVLALMASGLNGQCFAFHGYLPIDAQLRVKTLKQLEQQIYTHRQTQIFIETPYRNQRMFQDILAACRPDTYLCLATDISLPTEDIRTRRIADWRRNVPDLSKRLCVFVLGSIG